MEHVISWTPDGKGFKVHNPKEFERKFLAKNFKMKKYASFTRQLCAYGFSCVRKGRQTGIYFHPSFIRGSPDECSKISRGGTKSRSAASKKCKSRVAAAPTHKAPPKVVSNIDQTLDSQQPQFMNEASIPEDAFSTNLYNTDHSGMQWTTVEPELSGRVSPEPSSPVMTAPAPMSFGAPVSTSPVPVHSKSTNNTRLPSNLNAPSLEQMTRDLIEDGLEPITSYHHTEATPEPMPAPGVWIDDDSFEPMISMNPPQETPQPRMLSGRGTSDSFEPIPLSRMEGMHPPSTHAMPVPRRTFASPERDISASVVEALLDTVEPSTAYT
eukprot:scaffold2504_cov94-Cylindrotheca_fusiformis.AAC.7